MFTQRMLFTRQRTSRQKAIRYTYRGLRYAIAAGLLVWLVGLDTISGAVSEFLFNYRAAYAMAEKQNAAAAQAGIKQDQAPGHATAPTQMQSMNKECKKEETACPL